MKEEKAKKLARKYFLWWTQWLGLRYEKIDLIFVDNIQTKYIDGSVGINPKTAGSCDTDWRYQESTISINKQWLTKLSKEGIEKLIVHELMHVLLNEMREEGIDHEERVATNLQKAFFWVRDGVQRDA